MKQTRMQGGESALRRLVWLGFGALLAAFALSLTMSAPALAQTVQKSWTVEFTGTAMKDDGSSTITKTISGMQPGDSAEFDIDLFESYNGAADWYMRNEVLKTMEKSFADANSNSGGSYSYQLVYVNPQGERKVILTNDTVSGDAGSGGTQGLFDATTATGEWFYLDTLASQARAQVILSVSIDGETHGNPYFDTNAKVQLAFAAEPAKDNPGTPSNPVTPEDSDDPQDEDPQEEDPEEETPTEPEKKPTKDLSQTGDMVRLGMLVVVAAVAAAVMVAVVVRNRRSNDKSEEGEAR